MTAPLSTFRDLQVSLLEAFALLAALTGYIAAMLLGISVDAQIYATVAMLCTLLMLCWRNTGGGMHPCFLFLGLLLLFQGGRLLAFCIDPSQITPLRLESSNGLFDPATRVRRLTLLTIVVSAVFLYIPVRITGAKLVYTLPPSAQLTPYILCIFVLTLPFLIWKNYLYLSFVNSHGGYLAIYLAHDELIAQAGTLVRVLSRICATSFLVYFAYERPNRTLVLITALFFGVSVMELLLGLRGDVMLTGIGCLFLWKLKRGTHFTFRSLVFLALGLALVGELVAGSRENKDTEVALTAIPETFAFSQGTSLEVPEGLISNYDSFARHRLTYIPNAFLSPPIPINAFAQGELLEQDLNLYLNPVGASAGYGLGGSYLADSYLLGGLAGVAAVALLISFFLVLLTRYLAGYTAPYAVSMILCLVYATRNSTAGEIATGLQMWIFISAVFVSAWVLQRAFASFSPKLERSLVPQISTVAALNKSG